VPPSMANLKGTARNLTPLKPGASPNPGGKPADARNRVQAKFISALADDFDQHGPAAIAAMREKDPASYIRAIVSLSRRNCRSSDTWRSCPTRNLRPVWQHLRRLSAPKAFESTDSHLGPAVALAQTAGTFSAMQARSQPWAHPASRGNLGRRFRKQSRQLNRAPTNTPPFF
jgi:hypothetical protein